MALGLALLSSACDTFYGINRTAMLHGLPDLDCVEAAIRSVPEVREVRYWREEGGRPLTWTGLQEPDDLYYFTYELGSVSPTLSLSMDYKGRVELSQHLLSINVPLPPGSIEVARPVMLKVESALEEMCGVGTLSIREH